MSDEPAVLHWQDKEIKLPVDPGHRGRDRRSTSRSCAPQTGLITLDYGYVNTGATESAITYIDGDAGILRYRGYDIEALADRTTRRSSRPRGCSSTANCRPRPSAIGSATRSGSTRCCART